MATTPARLLRDCRTAAGLSQRALARRARTSQSVVARIELGETSPTWQTLARLLAATGFDLTPTPIPRPVLRSHMLDDVSRILSLSPEARLREVANASRFLAAVRRA